ncbi:MAG: hypothetical protein JXA67_10420, partial [Micromonosporaceae bacterium]|nr:hypothetical protein [Micromonosporaceae bacterium]
GALAVPVPTEAELASTVSTVSTRYAFLAGLDAEERQLAGAREQDRDLALRLLAKLPGARQDGARPGVPHRGGALAKRLAYALVVPRGDPDGRTSLDGTAKEHRMDQRDSPARGHAAFHPAECHTARPATIPAAQGKSLTRAPVVNTSLSPAGAGADNATVTATVVRRYTRRPLRPRDVCGGRVAECPDTMTFSP